MSSQPIRILIAKPGLDGHDRGAKVIARGLRDAGMEVIYTGLRQTPAMIAESALQEDVALVGLSILSGSHMTLAPAVREAMDQLGLQDIPLVLGGIVPDGDQRQLLSASVAAVFGPGASLDEIVTAIRGLTAPSEDERP